MEISAYLHNYADKSIRNKQQAIIKSFAKALEVIPRQLCDNAGFDATDILNRLRVEHRKGNVWAGVDFDNEGVRDNLEAFVWEPSLVKVNAIQAAVEASCLILSVDETISMFFFLFFSFPREVFVWIRSLSLLLTPENPCSPTQSWRRTTLISCRKRRIATTARAAAWSPARSSATSA